MKKAISILLVLVMTMSLCACGSAMPDGCTKKTYNCGKDVLRIMDQYIAGQLDGEGVKSKLSDISDRLKAESTDMEKETADGDVEAIRNSFYNGSVSFWISAFLAEMYGNKQFQTVRDNLADVLSVE